MIAVLYATVLQDVVLGVKTLTGMVEALLKHEVSLHGIPGAARAGPMTARRRAAAIIAMNLGMFRTTLFGKCEEKCFDFACSDRSE